jgi:hypothetical protein
MPATFKCRNGHTFTVRVVEDDPETNSMTTDPDACPECESIEIECVEVYGDDEDWWMIQEGTD